MENTPFGTYIKQLREEQKIPLRKLAAALDIDTSTLSKIERQKRFAHPKMLPILAEALGIELFPIQVKFWTEKLLLDMKAEENLEGILESILDHIKTGKITL